jgi:hypothetical protein
VGGLAPGRPPPPPPPNLIPSHLPIANNN